MFLFLFFFFSFFFFFLNNSFHSINTSFFLLLQQTIAPPSSSATTSSTLQGNIRVQIRHSKGRIVVSVNESDTISQIKAYVVSKGIQCATLALNGTVLDGNKTVRECGIAGASLIAA